MYVIERSFAEQLDMTSDDVKLIEEINADEGVQLAVLLPERRPTPHLLPLRGTQSRRDHRRRQAGGDPGRRSHRSQSHHGRHVPLTHAAQGLSHEAIITRPNVLSR